MAASGSEQQRRRTLIVDKPLQYSMLLLALGVVFGLDAWLRSASEEAPPEAPACQWRNRCGVGGSDDENPG